MAVPRPLLLTLLGTVLLAVTFMATRNARDQAAEEPSPPVQEQAAVPEQTPKPAEGSKPRADKSQATGRDTDKAAPAKPRTDKASPGPEKRATPKRATRRSMAPAVRRAIKNNRLVVLFLYQRGGSDDHRVAESVNSLRRHTKAAVFRDRIANLGKYGQIATSVGVTRAPSIVIIGKGRRGRLIEGYVDPDTLAQRVADAR
ncbi:MAG TPA: hypothetical protein VHG69_10270 [Thermoleophilaceae bacterium]|nr:hypothetical protein [Thermoleophilaceae bacterium]